jgi:hypothetical protein
MDPAAFEEDLHLEVSYIYSQLLKMKGNNTDDFARNEL